MTVVATAGHVDHGKSTLVHALTGVDPDRWAEEKARGLTIDLGFAHLRLPEGEIAFVDVPGHERFIRNMLAGVGAVDGCLFVVALTEGWKPQSEEHLRIVDLLGVGRGVVALTMLDAVDGERVDAVRADIAARVARTCLAAAPIVAVSARTGDGLEALREALGQMVVAGDPPGQKHTQNHNENHNQNHRQDRNKVHEEPHNQKHTSSAIRPPAIEMARPRLWLDRAFTRTGHGTIVTGTLTGGPLHTGDRARVEPGGLEVRIRALQRDGRRTARIGPGRRVAANLTGPGVSVGALGRGRALVLDGEWHLSGCFDATCTVLAGHDAPVRARGAHLLHLGTGEWAVRLQPIGDLTAIEPGATGVVRIHLPERLPLAPGDRFVLRDAGRRRTVGGGQVLDVDPVLPARRARPDLDPERIVLERGSLTADELARRTGVRYQPDVADRIVAPQVRSAAVERLVAELTGAGQGGLDLARLDDLERAIVEAGDLAAHGGEVVNGRLVARPSGASPAPALPWLVALRATPFAPPAPDRAVVDAETERHLVRQGLVVRLDGRCFAADAVDAAATLVAEMLARQPGGVTVGEVRDRMATSRNLALSLLDELDRRGITRRRGDRRFGGPRLPQTGSGVDEPEPPPPSWPSSSPPSS